MQIGHGAASAVTNRGGFALRRLNHEYTFYLHGYRLASPAEMLKSTDTSAGATLLGALLHRRRVPRF